MVLESLVTWFISILFSEFLKVIIGITIDSAVRDKVLKH